MNLSEGLNKYKHLNRSEYFEKNQELSKSLWENQDTPTVFDIADFMSGNENQKMERIFEFFDNKEEFLRMATRTDSRYEQEESSNFIRKVMSANNEDISKAGYFYKLLMASADDFIRHGYDCKSDGVSFDVGTISKEIYNYRVKSMYVNELKDFCNFDFERFVDLVKDLELELISVRTPLTCNQNQKRMVCSKCAGNVPDGTKNIGTFTALMVTEHATQSALSSMNKGVKENINDLLALRYDGAYRYEDIHSWIASIVSKLVNNQVQARFYEIALLSRIREDQAGPFVSSLKGSINHSKNLFGAYIFNPNHKNFEKIVRSKSFYDESLKLKIAMNNYDV